jgi:hypothetical protein
VAMDPGHPTGRREKRIQEIKTHQICLRMRPQTRIQYYKNQSKRVRTVGTLKRTNLLPWTPALIIR